MLKFVSALLLIFCLGLTVQTAYAQPGDPVTPLAEFIAEQELGNPGRSDEIYAQAEAEWEIVSFLRELHTYGANLPDIDENIRSEILAYTDNEIVWFEQHVARILEVTTPEEREKERAQARGRYAQYPAQLDTITLRLQLARILYALKEAKEVHSYLYTYALDLQNDSYDVEDVMILLGTLTSDLEEVHIQAQTASYSVTPETIKTLAARIHTITRRQREARMLIREKTPWLSEEHEL